VPRRASGKAERSESVLRSRGKRWCCNKSRSGMLYRISREDPTIEPLTRREQCYTSRRLEPESLRHIRNGHVSLTRTVSSKSSIRCVSTLVPCRQNWTHVTNLLLEWERRTVDGKSATASLSCSRT
jgi:hypothetical protein